MKDLPREGRRASNGASGPGPGRTFGGLGAGKHARARADVSSRADASALWYVVSGCGLALWRCVLCVQGVRGYVECKGSVVAETTMSHQAERSMDQ